MINAQPPILVVDDNEANLYVRSRVLRQAGFAVIEARTGSDCLRLVASARPSLVLLDMNLPDLLGSEVCRRIKADAQSATSFVLHISASLISPRDRAHALNDGADGYLIEPVEPEELLATVRALLRLQQAEARLRESEARFRAVQQATPDGYMIFASVRDSAGVITDFRWLYLNPASEQMVGRTEQELVGKCLLVEMPGNRAEGLFDAYVAVVESGQVWQREFYYPHEGIDRWFRSTAAKAGDGFAVAFSDITARKQAEQALQQVNATLEQRVAERTQQLAAKNLELERSNRELDKFAYVASHDLKSPLRAIEHLAQWISQDAGHLLPDASQVHLTKLHGRVQRMKALLDDLLAYSRVGRLPQSYELVNLQQLLGDILILLNAPPTFHVTVVQPLPTIHTQRIPLETVLRNLISNAIKHHNRPDGQVQIAVHEQGEWLEFVIRDDGPGIDPQFFERIFEIFQTLKPRDHVEGSGMGLAIVKKTLDLVGGTITVESDVGAGTTFRFTWPTQGQ